MSIGGQRARVVAHVGPACASEATVDAAWRAHLPRLAERRAKEYRRAEARTRSSASLAAEAQSEASPEEGEVGEAEAGDREWGVAVRSAERALSGGSKRAKALAHTLRWAADSAGE